MFHVFGRIRKAIATGIEAARVDFKTGFLCRIYELDEVVKEARARYFKEIKQAQMLRDDVASAQARNNEAVAIIYRKVMVSAESIATMILDEPEYQMAERKLRRMYKRLSRKFSLLQLVLEDTEEVLVYLQARIGDYSKGFDVASFRSFCGVAVDA